jgi:hypothetical protein
MALCRRPRVEKLLLGASGGGPGKEFFAGFFKGIFQRAQAIDFIAIIIIAARHFSVISR